MSTLVVLSSGKAIVSLQVSPDTRKRKNFELIQNWLPSNLASSKNNETEKSPYSCIQNEIDHKGRHEDAPAAEEYNNVFHSK